MKQKINKNYFLLVFIAVGYLLLFSPYTTLLNDYYGYDTALWNVIGKGITQGFVPYRDLFEHKGPLLFFIYAFQWLFSNHRLAMFLLQWVFFTATLVYLFKTCQLWMDTKKAWLSILFFLFLFCGTIGEGAMSEELSLPWIAISLYLVNDYCKKRDLKENIPIRYGFTLGIMCGIVVMIRMNNAAPLVGVLLGVIILACRKKNYLSVVKNAGMFIVGFMLPCIPIIVWYAAEDALDYMWWGAFLFNFHYSTNANVVQPLWEIIRPWLASIPILVYAYIVYAKIKREESKDILIIWAISGIFTSIIILFGSSFMHYFTIILPFYMIGFGWLIGQTQWKVRRKSICTVLLIIIMASPFTWQAVRNAGKSILLNTRGWYDELQDEIYTFLSQIPEEERNSVWGNGSSFSKVYCIGNITPCFPYIDNGQVHYVMDPTMNVRTEEMFENNPPKWIVVVNLYEPKIEALVKYVPKMYDLVDVLDGEKHLELYRLR